MQEFRVALERAIRGKPGKSLMPIGLRGVGKTVLLNKFVAAAEERGCEVAFVEAPETGAFGQLLAAQLRGVLSELDRAGPLSTFVKRAIGVLKSFSLRVLFNFPRITPFSDKDAREAIAEPAKEMGVAFAEDALTNLVEITKGYPYFIQEWAYEVWNSAIRSPIAAEIVERVGPIVQDKLDESFFSVRVDRLTPTERRYLRAMAELGAGPHRSGDIAGQYGATVERVAPTRSALIEKGMVYSPAHGDTAFTVPLFDEFMRRVVPAEPKKRIRKRRP